MALEYQIYQEAKEITPSMQEKVLDYIHFLMNKQERIEEDPLSEGSVLMVEDYDVALG